MFIKRVYTDFKKPAVCKYIYENLIKPISKKPFSGGGVIRNLRHDSTFLHRPLENGFLTLTGCTDTKMGPKK